MYLDEYKTAMQRIINLNKTYDIEPNKSDKWVNPKDEDLDAEDFELVWNCIKKWDVNVPWAYDGYCHSTGNHVMQILFALRLRDFSDYYPNNNKE